MHLNWNQESRQALHTFLVVFSNPLSFFDTVIMKKLNTIIGDLVADWSFTYLLEDKVFYCTSITTINKT